MSPVLTERIGIPWTLPFPSLPTVCSFFSVISAQWLFLLGSTIWPHTELRGCLLTCLLGIINLFVSHKTALVDIFWLILANSKYVCVPTPQHSTNRFEWCEVFCPKLLQNEPNHYLPSIQEISLGVNEENLSMAVYLYAPLQAWAEPNACQAHTHTLSCPLLSASQPGHSWHFTLGGSLFMHCRVSNNIPDPHPLDSGSKTFPTPPVATMTFQMSPGGQHWIQLRIPGLHDFKGPYKH